MNMTSGWNSYSGNQGDEKYLEFLISFHEQFRAQTAGKQLFTTNATELFATYLNSFTHPIQRQHHNCRTCRHFIEHFGGLVTINPDGTTQSAIWDLDWAKIPSELHAAMDALSFKARSASVNGVFYSSDQNLGKGETGVWRHMAVSLSQVIYPGLVNAEQAMAEKKQEYEMLQRALGELSGQTLALAIDLLQTNQAFRGEKVLGHAQWLYDLHKLVRSPIVKNKNNIIWLAVAKAPKGYAHVRTSMIWTLLEDLEAGLHTTLALSRFNDKMNPLKYQRPQAGPKAQEIDKAEKIVQTLGLTKAFNRRFAFLAEVDAFWSETLVPYTNLASGDGVFQRLRAEPKPLHEPHGAEVITWTRFQREVLPRAKQIELMIIPTPTNHTVLTTAVDPEAPRLFQWDNHFSWYVWSEGSSPRQWGLMANSWVSVPKICYKPCHWYGKEDQFPHMGKAVILMLQGAKESRSAGAGLFPEHLRSELHEIRSVIEAFSKSGEIAYTSKHLPQAAGLMIHSQGPWNHTVRVTTESGLRSKYTFDRWD